MPKKNKICIFGMGYVGLVTGACLSNFGNKVICVDVDEDKIKNLNNGVVDIYEPGLNDLVKNGLEDNNLEFTTDGAYALNESDICFICVGTPMRDDGTSDLSYIYEVASFIGSNIFKDMFIIQKSTVPIGENEKISEVIQNELDKRNVDLNFEVISNPEFLSEGSAVYNFMNPDRIIAGVNNESSKEIVKNIFIPIIEDERLICFMDVRSAELTKYASNCMLATKISFMNELSRLCELTGANINEVKEGMSFDPRIGDKFLNAGCGFGGSCFPKDINALISIFNENSYKSELLNAVNNINDMQMEHFSSIIMSRFNNDISDKVFALWGLSFKPNTNDVRCSPALVIANRLVSKGAKIQAYDPKVQLEDENISLASSKYDALNNADALIVATEWDEFVNSDFNIMKETLNQPIIFDGRNIFDCSKLKDMGFEYHQIGVNN